MTRGDKIRSMTDEQLADIIFECEMDSNIDFCKSIKGCEEKLDDGGIPESACKRCLVEWLGEEEEMNEETKKDLEDIDKFVQDFINEDKCHGCFGASENSCGECT